MGKLTRVAVFCGSSPGADPAYRAAARRLAEVLAGRGIGLVYGGANVGLMGEIARAALEHGAPVIGVIPDFLVDYEVAMTELDDLRIVGSMHERKAAVAELADGFIAMPGGLGTLEEFFEAVTWAQLRLHSKPCGLLDVNGYYSRLVDFLDHAVAERFVKPAHRAAILISHDPDALLDQFERYEAPPSDKWIDRGPGRI
jgi:uncharacterized protein (TIGR00730 family)